MSENVVDIFVPCLIRIEIVNDFLNLSINIECRIVQSLNFEVDIYDDQDKDDYYGYNVLSYETITVY